jgi:thiamine-phosphate pyrophosphorylase
MPTLDRPQLHLVTDPRLPGPALLAALDAASTAGVDWVHVRRPDAAARELVAMTRDVLAICRPRGVRVAVNDRLDVALALAADGVQLGARSLPVGLARGIAGNCRIGASVHSLAEARQAAADGADWLIFGHVFATGSHPGEPPRGIATLAAVAGAVAAPVIAIGGITAERVSEALGAGAAGVAVISAILAAPDPAAATMRLRLALDAAQHGSPQQVDEESRERH